MNQKALDIGIYTLALLLAASLFLPITALPVIGEVTYYQVAEIETYIIIALCIAAPAIVLMNLSKLLLVCPAGIWLTLLFPAIRQQLETEDGGMFARATRQAQRILQDFASDLFLNIAEFSWGGYVFLAALVGFTILCLVRAFR